MELSILFLNFIYALVGAACTVAFMVVGFKGKWLVLFFYPLDFTFVCPTEIMAFHNKTKAFKKEEEGVIRNKKLAKKEKIR